MKSFGRLWGFMKKFFVCPKKGGVILEPAQIADVGDRHLFPEKLPRHEKPFAVYIPADGIAGFLLKSPHQVVFA